MHVLSAILSIALSIFVLSRLNYQKDIYSNSGVVSITGARCFLALLVMMSHSIHYLYEKENKWVFDANFKLPFGLDNFYATSGKLGVLIFFMISGFLFYRVIYKEAFSFSELILKRLKRIAPTYWASMAVIILIAMVSFNLNINSNSLVDIIRWSTFTGTYNIGGVNTAVINYGVDWTLKLEWILYFSLLPLGFLTKGMSNRKKDLFLISSVFLILIIATAMRIYGHIYTDPRPVLGFVSGLMAFRLKSIISSIKNSKIASFAAIIAILIGLFSCVYSAYYLIMLAACTIAFFVFSSGNDIFGLLSKKTIVSLGEVSYSIYLFHGIVLFMMSKLDSRFSTGLHENIITLIIFNSALIITSSYIAKFTYINIEKRFYR